MSVSTIASCQKALERARRDQAATSLRRSELAALLDQARGDGLFDRAEELAGEMAACDRKLEGLKAHIQAIAVRALEARRLELLKEAETLETAERGYQDRMRQVSKELAKLNSEFNSLNYSIADHENGIQQRRVDAAKFSSPTGRDSLAFIREFLGEPDPLVGYFKPETAPVVEQNPLRLPTEQQIKAPGTFENGAIWHPRTTK